MQPGGIGFTTTLPAPMIAAVANIGHDDALLPIQVLRPICTGRVITSLFRNGL